MFDAKERNRKINDLIEAAVTDFCKLYSAAYEIKDDAIIVYHNNGATWSYLYAEFLDRDYMTMMFYEDLYLLATYGFEWDYKNYALLKSKPIIEIFTQLQNVSEIKQDLIK